VLGQGVFSRWTLEELPFPLKAYVVIGLRNALACDCTAVQQVVSQDNTSLIFLSTIGQGVLCHAQLKILIHVQRTNICNVQCMQSSELTMKFHSQAIM
jgi:hypothetical protein